MSKQQVSFFWFRRDLRLEDNVGLFHALKSQYTVIPLFIFDDAILDSLPYNDPRVGFIYENLSKINTQLLKIESALLVKKGKTLAVWELLLTEFDIKEVFFNKDYEPYAIKRDSAICELLETNNAIPFSFKDQVIFEEKEINTEDGLRPLKVETH